MTARYVEGERVSEWARVAPCALGHTLYLDIPPPRGKAQTFGAVSGWAASYSARSRSTRAPRRSA